MAQGKRTLTFSYSWAGLTESEFSRISLVCDGACVVPRNGPGMDKYPNVVGPNQACTLYGARPGSSTVGGADYIKAGYTLDVGDLWRRNFLVVLGWFFFILPQIFVIEYLQVGNFAALILFLSEFLINGMFLGTVFWWRRVHRLR